MIPEMKLMEHRQPPPLLLQLLQPLLLRIHQLSCIIA